MRFHQCHTILYRTQNSVFIASVTIAIILHSKRMFHVNSTVGILYSMHNGLNMQTAQVT